MYLDIHLKYFSRQLDYRATCDYSIANSWDVLPIVGKDEQSIALADDFYNV
jgi:hypothetical protein